MSITLDPKQGVNPHLVSCRVCGGETPEIVLLGNKGYTCECQKCGQKLLGTDKCPCGGFGGQRTKIEPHEKLPIGLCDTCKANIEAEQQEMKAEVERGGVYFRCLKCGMQGVVKAEAPIAIEVRRENDIPAPNPLGIEVESCPHCEAQE